MPKRAQKFNDPFIYDSVTGRICAILHPDGTEEQIILSNINTGTPVNGVKAVLVSDMTNANADVTSTAVNYGADGNLITVTYVDPGAINQALKVLVNGNNIVVNLATNGAGAITSTCNQVVAAINAHVAAKLLVLASAEGTGLGVVNAKAIASLAGGVTCTAGVPGSSMMKDSSGFFYIKTGEQTWSSFTTAIVDATTTVKGKVELATDTETQTGTDTVRAITPSNLSARTASESRTGIAEMATVAELLAGIDQYRIPTAVGIAALMAINKNPLQIAQGIGMSSGASGGGVAVADNNNLDFGTGNYTIRWKGMLPDFTPSATVILAQKTDGANGWLLQLTTAGLLQLVRNAEAAKSSTVALSCVDGTEHEIVCVVTTETATVDGSVTFYVDGLILGAAVTIAAGAPTTVTNAVPLYVLGTSTARYAGKNHALAVFNRALPASAVLDLYRNGIHFAEKWGNQTSRYTSDFSVNEDGWVAGAGITVTGNTDAIGGEDDWLKAEAGSTVSIYANTKVVTGLLSAGKKYRMTLKYFIPSANTTIKNIRVYTADGASALSSSLTVLDAATVVTFEFTAPADATSVRVYGQDGGATIGDLWYVKSMVITQVGAVIALEPEGIQPNPGQWLDASGNKLHGWQPASGSLITRLKKTFEIRGVNTWAGTHEAQSISMLTDASRAMLPVGCRIESIVGVIAGATIEDIQIGDGADAGRWVALTAGLAAGTVEFTLANKISDGTNYEMVVDPDANFTGSITWTIRGYILD